MLARLCLVAGARALALAVCSCGGGMQQRGRRQPRQLRWRRAAPLQRQQLREDMRLRRRPLLRTALPHHQQLSCQERYPLVFFWSSWTPARRGQGGAASSWRFIVRRSVAIGASSGGFCGDHRLQEMSMIRVCIGWSSTLAKGMSVELGCQQGARKYCQTG